MPKVKQLKTCPRCQRSFECKVDDILNCQCYGVQLSPDHQQELKKTYPQDCLCRACLEEMNTKTGNP